MRVIVTGSRDWADRARVYAALDQLLGDHRDNLTIVHGACPTGADQAAEDWFWDRKAPGLYCQKMPADWQRYGRAAGPARNRQMVAAGADLVLAFFQPGAANRGTADCVRRAEAAGIPVRRYPQETTMADPDRACQHEDFNCYVAVNRIQRSDDDPTIIGYSADITVNCRNCGEPFRWTGLQAGLSPARPMCSVDEKTLVAPLRPASADPDFGLGLPGYAVRFRGPEVDDRG